MPWCCRPQCVLMLSSAAPTHCTSWVMWSLQEAKLELKVPCESVRFQTSIFGVSVELIDLPPIRVQIINYVLTIGDYRNPMSKNAIIFFSNRHSASVRLDRL